ncbi:SDR family NAD(P)-dependent oxidoreductase [Rhodoferax sp.]|uniref:SDR family NAD(P)-dependent oxidoreductase n=1 Tax=Rhodoferax sp. TaxID=50421 RepID=UPI0008CD10E4|nr:SDR family NAD(P)-dependent oxidoreductase [Rhodoferax sp.]MDO8320335.1 SDR family NAD(P)-dependent oxidoreductase [Rhodoferax sp.]OGB41130.1 MAG: short-chain dehydrogenase [Burkholderiales bacterium RIFOXYC2_FULL_59_8]OGB53034.1 MAG: short-chain dehydrogenase [Burkholderiales bacterium RIFOXYD12_FULL_59_19]OGB80623.1 MAG: short-chain dehydrogenase [Burkholderiales bacterium RIFOXYC12_FULL_60_6]
MSHPVTSQPAAALVQRTVLVTGAAKLLGREIALSLASAGWRVAVHYRDSVEEARRTVADCNKLSGGCASFRANLANETAVRNLLPGVIGAMGQVDAVVNSASTFEHDTAATFSFAAMEKHLRANTGAAILLSQALHTHLLTREGATGAVVNLLDQKLWNSNPDFTSYTLSKAALESANTMLALALAPRVRVVGVASGLLPLGRMSTAADVAATVAFALENRSITGTTLLVDGGQHLLKSAPNVAPL